MEGFKWESDRVKCVFYKDYGRSNVGDRLEVGLKKYKFYLVMDEV